MRKICFLAPVHIYDDIRIFYKEASSLRDSGYDVTIIARANGEFNIDGIKIKGISYKNRTERFCLIPKVLKFALKEDADVYHIHNPETIVIGIILKLFNKKVIYDCHENFIDKVESREWIPTYIKKFCKIAIYILEKIAGKIFDAIIVTQKDVKDRISEKAHIIENPPILKMINEIQIKSPQD